MFGKVKNVQTIEYSVVFQNEEVQKEEIVIRSVKHYNREDYMTENTEFYTDSTMFQKEIYIYDDYRNLLEHTYFDGNGNITERYEFAYQYDSKNNWIQQIFYSGIEKTILSITERTIEYYE